MLLSLVLQNENNGLTVRSQLRHRLYTVHQLPDSQLHPRLRNRLIDIAAHLERANVSGLNGFGIFEDDKGPEKPALSSLKAGSRGLNGEVYRMVDAMRAAYLSDLIVR